MIQPEIFNRLLSTAPVTLVVLAAVLLVLGLIAYIAPLQIGARGVALPVSTNSPTGSTSSAA